MQLTAAIFERLVAEALNGLPPHFLHTLRNVEVVVEPEPPGNLLRSLGVSRGETLFGLYEGIPLTERTTSYGNVLPDKITIFQGPIQRVCESEDEVRAEVRHTVVHEVAHFFGIDDEQLERWGVY